MSYSVSLSKGILWLVINKKAIIKLEEKRTIFLKTDTPYSTLQKTKDAFVPPNPKELDNA